MNFKVRNSLNEKPLKESKYDPDGEFESYDMFVFITNLFTRDSITAQLPINPLGRKHKHFDYVARDGEDTFNPFGVDRNGNIVIGSYDSDDFEDVRLICDKYMLNYTESKSTRRGKTVYYITIDVPVYPGTDTPMSVDDYFEEIGIPLNQVMPKWYINNKAKYSKELAGVNESISNLKRIVDEKSVDPVTALGVTMADAYEYSEKADKEVEDRMNKYKKETGIDYSKPFTGTAKSSETKKVSTPSLKKMHLSESLFEDVKSVDGFNVGDTIVANTDITFCDARDIDMFDEVDAENIRPFIKRNEVVFPKGTIFELIDVVNDYPVVREKSTGVELDFSDLSTDFDLVESMNESWEKCFDAKDLNFDNYVNKYLLDDVSALINRTYRYNGDRVGIVKVFNSAGTRSWIPTIKFLATQGQLRKLGYNIKHDINEFLYRSDYFIDSNGDIIKVDEAFDVILNKLNEKFNAKKIAKDKILVLSTDDSSLFEESLSEAYTSQEANQILDTFLSYVDEGIIDTKEALLSLLRWVNVYEAAEFIKVNDYVPDDDLYEGCRKSKGKKSLKEWSEVDDYMEEHYDTYDVACRYLDVEIPDICGEVLAMLGDRDNAMNLPTAVLNNIVGKCRRFYAEMEAAAK